MLFQSWFLLGVKNISNYTHKTGSWYLLGILLKISDEHTYPFFMGVSPGLVYLRKQKKSIRDV